MMCGLYPSRRGVYFAAGLDRQDAASMRARKLLQGYSPMVFRSGHIPYVSLTVCSVIKPVDELCELLTDQGLLEKDRTEYTCRAAWRPIGRVIEPYLTDQWYVDARRWLIRRSKRCARAVPRSCQHNGKRRSSIGWRTSSLGAFLGKSGGAIRFPPGMGRREGLCRRERGQRVPTRSASKPTSRKR